MASLAIELKKAQVDLHRIQLGRIELELKIQEREEEIQRLRDHMKLSEVKEVELQKVIDDLKAQQ